MELEQTILRYEVMKLMETGKPFSMSYVTYDTTRGTGGELRSVTNWCKVQKDLDTEVRAPGDTGKRTEARYHPDHWTNATVNIYNPNNYKQHITKVRWPLITIFNSKRVIN